MPYRRLLAAELGIRPGRRLTETVRDALAASGHRPGRQESGPAAGRLVRRHGQRLGGTATAVNVAYNGSLAPGASTTFGMQLAGTTAAPTMSCANDAVPPTSASPSVTPPSGGDVRVTDADAGSTVTLLVGQTLGVSLPANYRPATANGSALSQLSSSGGFPTGLPFAALYRAAAPGSVDLPSQTDYAYLHTKPRARFRLRCGWYTSASWTRRTVGRRSW